MLKAARRFTEHKPAGKPLVLANDHGATRDGRTLFPSRVATPDEAIPLFKSGHNSRKIGSHVEKGMWKGMPIYTLTLEERATCSTACEHWFDCFGNKMHWSTRWRHGQTLEDLIPSQLLTLSKKHPDGFVVRLHVLGDFYSVEYVNLWKRMLKIIPQLHVFGYTRWRKILGVKGERPFIALSIDELNKEYPTRWRIRWSEAGGQMGTKSASDITLKGKTPDGIVCPAQTGQSDCCGTCGLCWNSEVPIVFITH
jgi:hypothetical protein